MTIRKEREDKEAKCACGFGSSREENNVREGVRNDPGERNENSVGREHFTKDLIKM